ncbi:MAG: acetate--CoA ligase family protein [Candidatus Woesearchaeota archaeon]
MEQLDLENTLKILKKHEIKLYSCELVKNKLDAIKVAERLGYPVAIKVATSFVVHKSDSGGVYINIKNKKEVEDAVEKITKNVYKKYNKKPDLFLVQKMAKGIELIIGTKNDPTFGPIIMFGLGGIFVEIFKDVSFRSIPLCDGCIDEMIKSIQAYKILQGTRGQKGINIKKLKNLMLKISNMITKENFEELDFNPVFADENDVYIADVRIMVDKNLKNNQKRGKIK